MTTMLSILIIMQWSKLLNCSYIYCIDLTCMKDGTFFHIVNAITNCGAFSNYFEFFGYYYLSLRKHLQHSVDGYNGILTLSRLMSHIYAAHECYLSTR